VFALLARRLEAEPGAMSPPVLRLRDDFAADPVWAAGLGVALDNLLLAFSGLRDGVETIADRLALDDPSERRAQLLGELRGVVRRLDAVAAGLTAALRPPPGGPPAVRWLRSEEHTSELQSRSDLVCRLLLEKKKNKIL